MDNFKMNSAKAVILRNSWSKSLFFVVVSLTVGICFRFSFSQSMARPVSVMYKYRLTTNVTRSKPQMTRIYNNVVTQRTLSLYLNISTNNAEFPRVKPLSSKLTPEGLQPPRTSPTRVNINSTKRHIPSNYTLPAPVVSSFNLLTCNQIIKGDFSAIKSELRTITDRFTRRVLSAKDYIRLAGNCTNFIKTRQYVTRYLTEEERNFPIAYSILMYKDTEQAERLLRAVYRPQNTHCIHVDKKSPDDMHEAMKAIAACFKNVFISSHTIDVVWGINSIKAEVGCLQDLWAYKTWKYFINLTGQEFPLKTNYELVKILKSFNGANIITGSLKSIQPNRYKYIWKNGIKTSEKKTPVPGDLKICKGSPHIVAQRGYVDYVLHNDLAKKFYAWVLDTHIPEETFFSTLNYNSKLHVPGSYKRDPDDVFFTKHFDLHRYKVWQSFLDMKIRTCHGKIIRGICILGVNDLPYLTKGVELFANKFFYEYQPLALDCLEEWYWNRSRTFAENPVPFDDTVYKNLRYVKYHY